MSICEAMLEATWRASAATLLLFGARLTLAGGRTGIVRTLITALGVGLGVAALLLAASLPTIHAERQARAQARDLVPSDSGPLLVGFVHTEFRGEDIRGRLLQAERAGADLPPGISRLPAPGELFVSPALADLLATPDGQRVLAPRLQGRVVGTIAADGLLGPHELGFYAGADDLVDGGPVGRVARFGTSGEGTQLEPTLVLLVVIALVALLIPGRRDRRRSGAHRRGGPRPAARRAAAHRRRPADDAADRGR